MNSNEANLTQQLDEAVSRRLARLRTMPVDLSKLSQAIHRQIPSAPVSQNPWRIVQWIRPVYAAAASLLVVGLILAVVLLSSRPALASADELASIHREMVAGHSGMSMVSTVSDANKVLGQSSPGCPMLPDMSGGEVRACCLHLMSGRKMSCASLEIDDRPVTMCVANASDIRLPRNETTVQRNNRSFIVMSSGSIHIVSTTMGERWISVVGEVPTEKLMDFAAGLKF